MTLKIGMIEPVVQEAPLQISSAMSLKESVLYPATIVVTSFVDGAEIITFLAPASKCFRAPSGFVKNPVASTTVSIPSSAQGRLDGSLSLSNTIFFPLMRINQT